MSDHGVRLTVNRSRRARLISFSRRSTLATSTSSTPKSLSQAMQTSTSSLVVSASQSSCMSVLTHLVFRSRNRLDQSWLRNRSPLLLKSDRVHTVHGLDDVVRHGTRLAVLQVCPSQRRLLDVLSQRQLGRPPEQRFANCSTLLPIDGPVPSFATSRCCLSSTCLLVPLLSLDSPLIA